MCCSYILTAARLISPVIERAGPVPGFDWCIEALTGAQHSALASEVALAKASWFLDHQNFGDAVNVLKVRCAKLRSEHLGNAEVVLFWHCVASMASMCGHTVG